LLDESWCPPDSRTLGIALGSAGCRGCSSARSADPSWGARAPIDVCGPSDCGAQPNRATAPGYTNSGSAGESRPGAAMAEAPTWEVVLYIDGPVT
jgi:hypothetical protein